MSVQSLGRRRGLLVLGLACSVAALTACGIQSDSSGAQPVAEETAPIEQLIGAAVGERLGLKAYTSRQDVPSDCAHTVEFGDGAGVYCLDGVTTDPVEEKLLGLQIIGFERTQTAVDFAEAIVQSEQDEDSEKGSDELDMRVAQLWRQLNDEQPNH
jgi:hypothetical protein